MISNVQRLALAKAANARYVVADTTGRIIRCGSDHGTLEAFARNNPKEWMCYEMVEYERKFHKMN